MYLEHLRDPSTDDYSESHCADGYFNIHRLGVILEVPQIHILLFHAEEQL